MLTKEQVNFLFNYSDGKLFWKNKIDPRSQAKIGSEAGTLVHQGYRQVSIGNKKHYLHRVIFLYHHGFLPETVDHIDNDTSNNSIENLRAATLSENLQNCSTRTHNKLGIKNVFFDGKANKYRVYVRAYNKQMYIGSYGDIDLADLIAQEARSKYHGTFANHK